MVEDDASYISLHQVYEDFCNRSGVHKDQAIDFYVKSVEEVMSKRTVCLFVDRLNFTGKRREGLVEQCENGNHSSNSSEHCARYLPPRCTKPNFIANLFSSLSGHLRRSLICGCSASNLRSNMLQLPSKHIFLR
jgi:hypothetical protein